ncbi:MAG: hypothetical protein ABI479_09225 [Gallionella sp.]
MNDPEQEIIDQNVRRTAGISALRKIGKIVANEDHADRDKARVVRWFIRYGWMIMLGVLLLLAYATGMI